MLDYCKRQCLQQEADVEEAHQAAAVLPPMEALDKILRFETKLERQMFRAASQLERLQRIRHGEAIPAPSTVDVSGRAGAR